MIRAAIFDMDGLLIDSEPLWRKAEIGCFAKVGIMLTEDDCRKTMGYRLNEVVDYWYAISPWENYSKDQLEADILHRVIELIRAEGKAMPGVHHALNLFESMHFKLALASSSALRLIEEVLRTLQLEDRFEVVKSAQHEPFGKPHPQVFISAAHELGVSPENCVVLEDSFHGVIAGKAAKMKVIAIPEHSALQQPRFHAAERVESSLENLNEQIIRQLFE
jgi:HAD superfamily hydrolase (TIGR01509 family)